MGNRVQIKVPAKKAAAVTHPVQIDNACPSRQKLKQVGTIKNLVADWRDSFEANETSYRESLYRSLASRYELAWAMWEDEEVGSRWVAEHGPLLASRVSEANDERFLRSVTVATISSPKNASKVFKRLSTAWVEGVEPEAIFGWVKKHKLQKQLSLKPIPLKQFDKTPLVLQGVTDVVKAEPGSKIVISGTVSKRSGKEIEIKSISVRVR